MNILWLLSDTKEHTLEDIKKLNPDHIISYRYRYLFTEDIIKEYPKIVNIHISVLPWNRGADPNFWSFYDNTPHGVTIHYIDKGIDTGPIIAQKILTFDNEMTLRETYEILYITGWTLLFNNIKGIMDETIKPIKQTHYRKDAYEMINSLSQGWDTKVGVIGKMKCV